MRGDLPFLLMWGDVIGWGILALTIVLGWWLGPRFTKNPKPRLGHRILHALIPAVGVLALSTSIGYGASRLAANGSGSSWLGVSVAAMTPFRGKALASARQLLLTELTGAFPRELDEKSQYYRTPLGLGGKAAERFVAFARFEKDCEQSPGVLSALAVQHTDLTDAATELSLECKRPLDLAAMADARFWESDFARSSTLFDRAEITWGETDKEAPLANGLVESRTKKEIFTHWYARRFDRALRTIDRYKGKTELHCLRHVMNVVANVPGAVEQLRKQRSECFLFLANVDPSERPKLLKEHAEAAHRDYLYQAWALELEPLLGTSATLEVVARESRAARIKSPQDLLIFPSGIRGLGLDPTIVTELFARVERVSTPSPARRLLRARMAAVLATTASLLGEHERAHELVGVSSSDLEKLLALPVTEDKSGPTQYEHDSFELEQRLNRVLEVAIELRAGRTDRATRAANEIPELVVPEKNSPWPDTEVKDLRASIEAVRAYVELWKGNPARLRAFASSESCSALTTCFVLRQNVELLTKAARGEVTSCEAHACLIAARVPAARPSLSEKLDGLAASAAVTENPLERLFRIGEARALARAIQAREQIERLNRWFDGVLPVAFDPRLAVARVMLDRMN